MAQLPEDEEVEDVSGEGVEIEGVRDEKDMREEEEQQLEAALERHFMLDIQANGAASRLMQIQKEQGGVTSYKSWMSERSSCTVTRAALAPLTGSLKQDFSIEMFHSW